jgi:AraC-like DNA-binding protein
MQLHRKLKGTIGQSTTEFMRCVRIKHAAELLSQGQHNVSEAMYEAGFDNPSYFNKVFKKICGVNPSEFGGQ